MTVSRSFTVDTILTYFSQALVVILGVAIVKIMASVLSSDELGIYLLSRRFIFIGGPIITLNLGMGLAWIHGINRPGSKQLFYLTIYIEIFLFLLTTLLISLNLNYFSRLLFDDEKFATMIYPVLTFLFASGFQVLFVGYWRGNRRYRMMNIANIMYRLSSLLVLVTIIFIKKEAFLITYFYSGGILIVVTNLILYFSDRKNIREAGNLRLEDCIELLQYSISRIPSGFFYGLLFYLPMVMAMKLYSLNFATLIGIVVTVITTISLAGSPLNLLLLPTFSNLRERKKQYIINKIEVVLTFIFQIVFFAGPLLFLFSDELIRLWFGGQYSQASLYLKIVSPTVGPFIGYVMVRGINDGLAKYPYSNINTFVALMVIITISFFLNAVIHNPFSLVIAFSAGLLTLFYSTMYSMKKIIELKILTIQNIRSIIYIILTYIVFYLYIIFADAVELNYSLLIKLIILCGVFMILLKRSAILRTIWLELIKGKA